MAIKQSRAAKPRTSSFAWAAGLAGDMPPGPLAEIVLIPRRSWTLPALSEHPDGLRRATAARGKRVANGSRSRRCCFQATERSSNTAAARSLRQSRPGLIPGPSISFPNSSHPAPTLADGLALLSAGYERPEAVIRASTSPADARGEPALALRVRLPRAEDVPSLACQPSVR